MRFPRSLFSGLLGQRGQSVIEAIMAVAVLGIAAETTALLVRAMVTQTVASRDRAFATEKSLQMLEELRELVLTNTATLSTLDQYNDGYCNTCTPAHPYYHWTLTTKYDVTHNTTNTASVPDWQSAIDPHSANPQRPNQGFAFVRYVDVLSTTKDANVRMIYVRVYAAAPNPGYGSGNSAMPMPVNPTTPPLAEVYGVVHSQGAVSTPDQVLDVYFVAIENVPGWWSRTSNLIPLMQSSIASLQAMNPGLVIRSHWIQTMSFGRDLEYTPEINAEAESATVTGSLKEAYVYPGYVNYDYPSSAPDYYYAPSWFLGRVNIGGILPSSASWPPASDLQNPNWGYAMADQFNHAMRYPDEERLFNVLTDIAANKGKSPPQISWRMLLEQLNENVPAVQNAIILNLQGELVPVPPLRNYSDAAKDPDYFWNNGSGAPDEPGPRAYRAVTQPEQLWYPQDVTVGVNVYAYDANPSEIMSDTQTSEVVDTITLFIPNASTANLYQIYRTQGNSMTPYYRFVSGVASAGGGFVTGFDAQGVSVVADVNTASSVGNTFYADNYSPPGRSSSGLRIQLFGTTPTARAYVGPEFSATNPSP